MRKFTKTLRNTASNNASKINAVQDKLHALVPEKIDTARRANLITMALAMGSLISCGNDFNDMMKEPTGGGGGGGGTPPGPTVQSVKVKTPPTRKIYGLNSADPFDFTDMVLTVTYSDGTSPDITYASADATLYSVSFDRTSTTTLTTTTTADVAYDGVKNDPTDNITGLEVKNIVARRTNNPGSTYTYHGYDNLSAAFASSGESAKTATITLYASETLSAPITLNYGTYIILTGNGQQTITGFSSASNPLFIIGYSGTGKLTLDGDAYNTITIKDHANTADTSSNGGAVFVSTYGEFIMNAGIISDNTAGSSGSGKSGGGVYVGNGKFTMNGGTISGNHVVDGTGGGVEVGGGTFIMNGGTISGNDVNGTYSLGGGVYVGSGTFTWEAGTISGNTATNNGDKVYKESSGTVNGTHSSVSSPTGTDSYGGTYWD